MLPLKEELLEEKSRQHQPQEKTTDEKGKCLSGGHHGGNLAGAGAGHQRLIRCNQRQLESSL